MSHVFEPGAGGLSKRLWAFRMRSAQTRQDRPAPMRAGSTLGPRSSMPWARAASHQPPPHLAYWPHCVLQNQTKAAKLRETLTLMHRVVPARSMYSARYARTGELRIFKIEVQLRQRRPPEATISFSWRVELGGVRHTPARIGTDRIWLTL